MKHPDEVARLREVYGAGLFLLAAYSPRDRRVKYLEEQTGPIDDSHVPALAKLRGYPPYDALRQRTAVGRAPMTQRIRALFAGR